MQKENQTKKEIKTDETKNSEVNKEITIELRTYSTSSKEKLYVGSEIIYLYNGGIRDFSGINAKGTDLGATYQSSR